MLQRCWAAFYGNVKAPGWQKLGMQRRLALLCRCVSPVVAHYVAIIPPTSRRGIELDRIQRRMVSAAIGNYRLTVETWIQFLRRTSHESAAWIEANSHWWSYRWLQRIIKWEEHLVRDAAEQQRYLDGAPIDRCRTRWSWAAALFNFHGSTWLSEQRVFYNRSNRLEGVYSRTGTRAVRGKIYTRFQEGIEHARRLL